MTSDELIRFCESFPGAYRDHPWGDLVFKVGPKIFVFINQHQELLTVTVKLDEVLRMLWDDRSDTFMPAYVGRYGWRGIRLANRDAWDKAQEGITVSYQLIAKPRRMKKDRQR